MPAQLQDRHFEQGPAVQAEPPGQLLAAFIYYFFAADSFGQSFFSASVHLWSFWPASLAQSVLAKAVIETLAKAATRTKDNNLRIEILLN
jgi:hypothetical protein